MSRVRIPSLAPFFVLFSIFKTPLGAAQILAPIGEAFAEAMVDL
jgi:hypothetical protein